MYQNRHHERKQPQVLSSFSNEGISISAHLEPSAGEVLAVSFDEVSYQMLLCFSGTHTSVFPINIYVQYCHSVHLLSLLGAGPLLEPLLLMFPKVVQLNIFLFLNVG